ncbi:hypothetical protein BS78_10G245900 [Paspalum vaginatum]|nr:hypothetical protein BS78_10G245900 [Paspalum vaginatum]
MSYPWLSFVVTIPIPGSAHSLRKAVAVLLPLHVPSLPSQYSWTSGSQNQDLVNLLSPLTQMHKHKGNEHVQIGNRRL